MFPHEPGGFFESPAVQRLFARASRKNSGPDVIPCSGKSGRIICRMRVALISTVFNEGEDIFRWAEALRKQTLKPDEFTIVDGGSMDGTPGRLKKAFSHDDFPAPKIIVQKCNIAGG